MVCEPAFLIGPCARALQLPSYDSIYLFLLDRSGETLWRGQGAHDHAQLAELALTVKRCIIAVPA